MSLRQVLTIYNAERQLSDDETALLNTLRKMTDAERGMFVDGLSDKPSQKKSSERTIEHCAACDYTRRAQVHKDAFVTGYHEFQSSAKSSKKSAGGGGGRSSSKSARASGMAAAISSSLSSRKAMVTTYDEIRVCQHVYEGGQRCTASGDDNVHHKQTDPNYHPFVSTAQAAEPSSNQVTSEIGRGVVSNVHHAGG